MFRAYFTIAIVTFIEHKAVEAMVIASSLYSADACRMFQVFGLFPYIGSVANEHI